jgi:hypothetical protein
MGGLYVDINFGNGTSPTLPTTGSYTSLNYTDTTSLTWGANPNAGTNTAFGQAITGFFFVSPDQSGNTVKTSLPVVDDLSPALFAWPAISNGVQIYLSDTLTAVNNSQDAVRHVTTFSVNTFTHGYELLTGTESTGLLQTVNNLTASDPSCSQASFAAEMNYKKDNKTLGGADIGTGIYIQYETIQSNVTTVQFCEVTFSGLAITLTQMSLTTGATLYKDFFPQLQMTDNGGVAKLVGESFDINALPDSKPASVYRILSSSIKNTIERTYLTEKLVSFLISGSDDAFNSQTYLSDLLQSPISTFWISAYGNGHYTLHGDETNDLSVIEFKVSLIATLAVSVILAVISALIASFMIGHYGKEPLLVVAATSGGMHSAAGKHRHYRYELRRDMSHSFVTVNGRMLTAEPVDVEESELLFKNEKLRNSQAYQHSQGQPTIENLEKTIVEVHALPEPPKK